MSTTDSSFGVRAEPHTGTSNLAVRCGVVGLHVETRAIPIAPSPPPKQNDNSPPVADENSFPATASMHANATMNLLDLDSRFDFETPLLSPYSSTDSPTRFMSSPVTPKSESRFGASRLPLSELSPSVINSADFGIPLSPLRAPSAPSPRKMSLSIIASRLNTSVVPSSPFRSLSPELGPENRMRHNTNTNNNDTTATNNNINDNNSQKRKNRDSIPWFDNLKIDGLETANSGDNSRCSIKGLGNSVEGGKGIFSFDLLAESLDELEQSFCPSTHKKLRQPVFDGNNNNQEVLNDLTEMEEDSPTIIPATNEAPEDELLTFAAVPVVPHNISDDAVMLHDNTNNDDDDDDNAGMIATDDLLVSPPPTKGPIGNAPLDDDDGPFELEQNSPICHTVQEATKSLCGVSLPEAPDGNSLQDLTTITSGSEAASDTASASDEGSSSGNSAFSSSSSSSSLPSSAASLSDHSEFSSPGGISSSLASPMSIPSAAVSGAATPEVSPMSVSTTSTPSLAGSSVPRLRIPVSGIPLSAKYGPSISSAPERRSSSGGSPIIPEPCVVMTDRPFATKFGFKGSSLRPRSTTPMSTTTSPSSSVSSSSSSSSTIATSSRIPRPGGASCASKIPRLIVSARSNSLTNNN